MKKFILWDNDGVLVDTEKYYLEANKIVLSDLGIKVDLDTFIRVSLQQGNSILELARSKNYNDEDILILRKQRDDIYEKLIAEENLAIEGVKEILESLYGKIGMGVVTSTKRSYFNLVHNKTGFHKFLDFVVAREDYKNSKPAPEPYLLGIEKSSFDTDDIIAIEDSERGLSAASQAGINCIIIKNDLTKFGVFENASKVLNSINELSLDLINSIN